MKLILIRHGQTTWNTERRTQGRTDIPLNEEGRLQAARLALRLEKENIIAIYTSPLSRASETANIIAAGHNCPPTHSDFLLERDFGIWEGEAFSMLREKYPDEIREWEENPAGITPENGETFESVHKRCLEFIELIKQTHSKDDTVVVVGHSVPIRIMIAHFIGLDQKNMHNIHLDNASYNELKLGSKRSALYSLNDCSHLNG